MFKRGELVFAKVRGHSPWPAKILKRDSPTQFKVLFFGTSETGKVKKGNIWNYNAKRETFAAKYGKRKSYALALKQIGEVASLASSKSTKKKAPISSATESGGKSAKEMITIFVDDENIPSISDINRMAMKENAATTMLDELVPTVGNVNLDEDIGKPIPIMFVDDENIPSIRDIGDEMPSRKDSNGKEVEKGNSAGMLRDGNQYEMHKLSRKNAVKDKLQKDQNIKKGNAKDNNIRSVARLNTRTNNKNTNETKKIEEIQRNDVIVKIINFTVTTTFPVACSGSR